MVRHFIHWLLFSIVLAMFVRAAEVTATLDATHVNPGDAVNLTFEIKGGQTQRPNIPKIENLTVQFQGQNQMVSIINGRTESVQSFQYVIGSHIPGVYTIPAITLAINGQNFTTKPLTFHVVGNGTTPQVPEPKAEDPERFGTLTLELAAQQRQYAYISEIAPVIIRAWLPMDAQVQLRSVIQPESKGFTLHNVTQQPQQSVEMRDNKQYRVLTWFGGISATKAGKHPVSLAMKATVAVPDDSQPALRQRNRPTMRIGGNYIEKEVTLSTKDQEIEVRPLPTEGKPENFSGAVGEFEFDGIEIPEQWKTGEPQKVALRIKGSGNFAIMQAPPLTPDELWNTYPGDDQFNPGDQASFSGNKIFQYNAIPRKAGSYPVTFTLHFFDPDKGAYQSIQSPTKTITVTGEDMVEESQDKAQKNDQTPDIDPASIPAPSRENDSAARSLSQWHKSGAFIVLLSFAGLLTLAGPIGAVMQSRVNDPQRKQSMAIAREIAASTKLTAQAWQAQDTAAYYSAARRTLQWHLSVAWKLKPEAITLADVQSRCATDSPLVAFFREADRCSYGAPPATDDWNALDARFQQALLSLPRP
jgi:hypothetical protein